LIFVPLVVNKARQWGWVDHPGERKIHKEPIPRVGGIAIWLAFTIGFSIMVAFFQNAPLGGGIAGILLGGGILFITGVLDDRFNLSPYLKLLLQGAAAWTAYRYGVRIEVLDLPESHIVVLADWSLPVTLLWLIGVTNAMNFIDGIDGLAGGVSTISAVTLAVVAVFTHQPIAAVLAALLAGSSLGFLTYNFFPARVFMGDSGSLFCGFALAAIAVVGAMKTPIVVVLTPVLVLTVPLMEIVYSTCRRLLQGKNPMVADSGHIHHRLIQAGLSQVNIVGLLYGVCVVAGLLVTYYVHQLWNYLSLMVGMFCLFMALMLLRFSSNPQEFATLGNSQKSVEA